MVRTGGTKTTVILLLASLVLLCGSSVVRAQRRGDTSQGGGPGSTSEKIVPMEYDNAPFDITRERLSEAYGGHNIQAVYNTVRTSLQKAAQVSEAGQSRETIPLAWTQKDDSIFAFQVKPAEVAYDKHGQNIRVSCQVWSILTQGRPDRTKRGFRIAYVPRVDHTYTYTGSDGKKTEIEEVKFREYTVAFGNLGAFSVERHAEQAKGASAAGALDESLRSETIVARISAAKKEADRFKPNIRLLVLCRLAEPYVSSETVDVRGTPEKPGEYLAQHEYLHIRLLELWLYDAYAGKILMKIRPDNDKE
jgi:hypothetical protein